MENIENMRWTRPCWTAKVNVLASETHGHPLHAPGENWRNQTMHCLHKGFVFVLTCLMLVSSASAQDQGGTAPPSNEAILQHMQQLEQEVKDLRAEIGRASCRERAEISVGA